MRPIAYFFLIQLTLLLNSCEDRDKVIEELTGQPKVHFVLPGGDVSRAINERIKVSLKSKMREKEFYISFNNEKELISEISYTITGGRLVLLPGEETITEREGVLVSRPGEKQGNLHFKFVPEPLTEHTYLLSVTAKNVFENAETISAVIETFRNMAPVARIEGRPNTSVDPLAYELDATGSHDPDASYGGGLVMLEFFVNGHKLQALDPSTDGFILRHVFPEAGSYHIHVVATDNDGAVTRSETRIIEVKG